LKKKPVVQAYAEYFAARVFAMVLQCTSIECSLQWARVLGTLWFRVDKRHRAVALRNLRLAFGGQWDEERIERVARTAFQHFAMVAVEVVWMSRLVRRSTYARYVTFDNWELFETAASSGRPSILITAHLGNWELLGYTATLLGHRFHTVARPLDNWLLDRYLVRQRERYGQEVIPRKGALRRLVRAARQNSNLVFVVDQNERRDGVFVDFFGRPASTVKSVAALALKMQIPILLGFGIREGSGFRYRLKVVGRIPLRATGDHEADVRRVTSDFTKRIEDYVRRHPEQWLWLHRRWKTQPPSFQQQPYG